MRQNEWHVIGRGLAGWHAAGINVTSSGGSLENGIYWTGQPTTGYLAGAVDGCLIYDASEADARAFTKLVMSGPMVDPQLDPGEVNAFKHRENLAMMCGPGGLEDGFLAIGLVALADPTYSGLDSVGVEVYRELLRAIPGIRIGTVTAGVIAWEVGYEPADHTL